MASSNDLTNQEIERAISCDEDWRFQEPLVDVLFDPSKKMFYHTPHHGDSS